MAEYALRLQNSADTAPRVRQGDGLALQHAGPLTARSGLRRDGGGVVSVVAGSMTVQVTPFSAWIDGGTSDLQAGYPFVLDATKTLTVADGDATLARVDTIAVVVHEDAFDGSGLTDATVVVVQGVPGAGAPALPATAMALRDVNVPAGLSAGTGGLAAANLGADRRAYTVASGGLLPVSGVTERDALPALSGQAVWREDTGAVEVLQSSGWQQVYPVSTAGFSLARAAEQSVPVTTFTPIVWETAERDDDNVWSSGSAAVITRAGWYVLSGGGNVENLATAPYRAFHLSVNGTRIASTGNIDGAGNIDAANHGTCSTPYYLQAGDSVELLFYHNDSAGAIAGGDRPLFLRGVRVGD